MRFIFDFQYITTIGFVYDVITFTVLTVFFLLIMNLVKSDKGILTASVGIASLKPGMLLADVIYKDGKTYKTDSGKVSRNILKLESTGDGLTEDDVKTLKRLHKEKRLGFSKVNVKQTVPFAPFIFLGVLLTIISSGVFLNLFI